MKESYGFVETQGLIGSVEAADAMLKAAKVSLVEKKEIGFGLVTVIVEGELGAVISAVDAGRAAAERIGQFLSANVIPNPYNDTEFLVQKKLPSSSEKKKTNQPAKKAESKPVKEKKVAERKKVENPTDAIIKFLKGKKNGASLADISSFVKIESSQCRVLLKQLIDEGIIEKVQQRYYIL